MQRLRQTPMLLVAGALCALAACAGDGAGERSPAGSSPDVSAHATHTRMHAASEVVMSLIAFRPEELTVAKATTVIWKQRDAGTHTVTSGTVETDTSGSTGTDPDGVFRSGELEKDEEFAFTFERSGTFAYFCEIHPATMRGRITVE
jgi:plastocyanin